ncbi:hypothetical protein NHH03_13715 [Stieleria sp. TO1_6]|uniref:hypothetical protein n=1 Tax=Stieleria tagensis TaxID=2956795 RepID=UPI00209ABC5D|nr:hypothetical protein [Stieleria tagensis]MCO8122800.1 hypothetical protein [Stieleria tagensis]
MSKLDLLAPAPGLLSPGAAKQASGYQTADGTLPAETISSDGSMTMEAYQRIRQAKAQNAVVLQVAGDEQPIRVLPLPSGQRSVFVSELLNQTGVLKKFGRVDATVYRPSPESISGIRMDVQFGEGGQIDPSSDYALRPGDRVQVRQRTSSGLQSLVDMALRR